MEVDLKAHHMRSALGTILMACVNHLTLVHRRISPCRSQEAGASRLVGVGKRRWAMVVVAMMWEVAEG